MSAVLQTRFSVRWFSDASLSQLKWIALALMVVDHVEAFWLQREFNSQLGRLVFPIFAFVLGYNLARPHAAHWKLVQRLLAFAILALPWHAILVGAWAPANVLVTFAVAVSVVALWQRERWWEGATLWLLAGPFVEYGWPGIGLVVGVWLMYAHAGSRTAWGPWAMPALMLALLCVFQWTWVPLLAAPLVWAWKGEAYVVPRGKWAFYVFYPAHLAAFVLMGAPGLR